MPEKQRFTLSIPEHIADELRRYSAPLSSNPTEYAALIVRKWYADGCPPVTPEEATLRKRLEAHPHPSKKSTTAQLHTTHTRHTAPNTYPIR